VVDFVADPEQIYQKVLQEEQGKGVTGAVAEGRAKAARARAENGSPHPKEPKWWPGAQPHLEGGGEEAAEEPAEEVAEEPAAEAEPEPAAEEPAAEAPAATEEQQAPELEQEQQTPPPAAAEAPVPPAAPAAEQPAAAAPEQPAAVPAQPAAAATAAVDQPTPTTGVTHGTTTGTRLRPEDEVTTEAQFEGQRAMYERRKLIDELVATGVPAVTANETARPRSPMLALLYLLIPLLAIFYLAGQESTEPEAGASETVATEEGGAEGGEASGPTTEITAVNTNWETSSITLVADEANELTVVNEDAIVHNLSIYPDEDSAVAGEGVLFDGPDVQGGSSGDYTIEDLKAGDYTFICDYHTNMVGDAVVE
jgi:plastocyanin